jgi:drug/metabolite transporter (DMT)-like permease
MWIKKVMNHGVFLSIAATFLWGTHSVLGRYLGEDIPPELISFSRLLIGAVTLYSLLLIKMKLGFKKVDIFRLKTNELWPIAILSIIVGFNLLLFHYGLKYTSANNAMVLESTAPVFVTLLTPVFFSERLYKRDLLLSVVAFLGILLIVYSNNLGSLSLFGDSLELLAGITWALFILLSIKFNTNTDSISHRIRNLMYVLFGAGIMLFIYTAFKMELNIELEWIIPLLYLGIFPTAIAYIFWFEAGITLKPTLLAIIFNLSIVFTVINSYIFLSEKLTYVSFIGIGIVIGAIILMAIQKERVAT